MRSLKFKFKKTLNNEVKIVIGKSATKGINVCFRNLNPDRVFVVSDSNVAARYGREVIKAIDKRYSAHLITHIPDESGKNLRNLEKIINEFFSAGGTYRSCICSLGGGVTGNIAGLAASIIDRGISLVHIPTTLLAQLDSAPDVKHSINVPGIKNAVGSYKCPDFVLIDPLFLESLSLREIKSGIAEAIKHGFSQDLQFVKFISSSNKKNKLTNLNTLERIVCKTISLKIRHWEQTPTKWNEKKKTERLTHIGHTIGKVLEMLDIDYLTHGEAISHGMVIETYISYLLGYLKKDSANYVNSILKDLNLLYPLNDFYSSKEILNYLYPKNSREKPVFALLKKLGNPETISTTISRAVIKKALTWYFKQA